MLDVTIETSAVPNIAKATQDYADSLRSAIAEELQASLRKKGNRIWPQRTHRSRRGFHVEVRGDRIGIANSAPYARFVNNDRTLRGGGANPNHGAVQRHVRQFWGRILRRAADRASIEDV